MNNNLTINKFRSNKSLFLLVGSALSIFFAGILLHERISLFPLILKIISVISITSFIYSFNDVLDNGISFTKKIFFNLRLGIAFFITLAIGSYFYIHEPYSAIILSIIFIVGTIYSLGIPLFFLELKLKRVFVLKNIFIGAGWAFLLLYGSGSPHQPIIQITFLFIFLQVFIGSIMRDLNDIHDDKSNGVITFPIKLGEEKTYYSLQLLNLLSFILIFIPTILGFFPISLNIVLLFVCFWRSSILILAKKSEEKELYLQTFNLLSCFWIFLGMVIAL